MKGRSQRLPAPAAPAMDDWGDGEDSWTVDCTCGVNYDDGEEMVNCDDCGVWVHTRCSRYVKEEESFTCDKCKAAGSYVTRGGGGGSNNSNEEAEVAELLAELPTKGGDKCPPPPPAPANHVHRPPLPPARVWFETPMEERAHIQGLPGGDPSIFEGTAAGSVFTASLWKACGYVPRKFNFKYREYRCWDDDDVDNPANTGADVLFSLSKETALPGPSMTASVRKSDLLRDPTGRDGKSVSPTGWLNPTKKERNKLRGFGVSIGKRKEVDPERIKEKAAKKARLSAKPTSGDKATTGSALGLGNCNPNTSRDEPLEASKPVSRDVKQEVVKRKESSSGAATQVRCNINCVDDSFNQAVTTKTSPGSSPTMPSRERLPELPSSKPEKVHKQHSEGAHASTASSQQERLLEPTISKPEKVHKQHSEGADVSTVLSQERLSEPTISKPQKVHKQHSEGADVSSRRDGSANSMLPTEPDSKIKKDDYAVIDALKQSKHSFNLNVSSSAVALESVNSKLAIDEFRPVGSESLDKPLPSPDLDRKLYSSSVEVKVENDTSWGSDMWSSVIQPSVLTCNDAEVKTTSPFEGSLKQSPVSCHVTSANATCKNLKVLDNDREPEVTNQASSRTVSAPDQQEEQPASKLDVLEGDSKLKPGGLHSQEPSRSGFMDSSAGSPRGIKRACSSAEDILESPLHMLDADLSTAAKTVPFQKRMKANADGSSDNERKMSLDPARDNLLGEATNDSVKRHFKNSRSSLDKSSQSSKANLLPASKHKSGDIKEFKHHSSSKTSSTENSGSSTGSGKPKSSSLVQSNSMPIKFRSSISHRKHEKNSSSSHMSNKASGTSVAALPPNVSPLTLSDEELAKRLHQELNSSPRVSRASRGFHGAGMQFSSPAASSMLSKRSSSSNSIGKAQDSVSKREPRRDGHNNPSGATKLDYLQPSSAKRQETRHTNGSARRDSHGILGEAPSTKKSSQPSSFTGPTMHLSSSNL